MNFTIAGVVVLYHPDREALERNLLSYLQPLGLLVVVDNTEVEMAGLTQQVQAWSSKIVYLRNQRNAGVAAALNQGAQLALDQGYNWLLTMDQDSFFTPEAARQYFSSFANLYHQWTAAAIVAPAQAVPEPGAPVFSFVHSVITSGSLVQLAVWKQVGGYKESLFIDEVDHEYAYRIQLAGYQVVRLNRVLLNHQLGTTRSAAYLGVMARRNRTVHAPWRVYFMVRNYLYVRRLYRKAFPDEFRRRDQQLRVALKNNLLFSGHFLHSCKSLCKGYRDYKKGIPG